MDEEANALGQHLRETRDTWPQIGNYEIREGNRLTLIFLLHRVGAFRREQ
jgi:hypothetical protein